MLDVLSSSIGERGAFVRRQFTDDVIADGTARRHVILQGARQVVAVAVGVRAVEIQELRSP